MKRIGTPISFQGRLADRDFVRRVHFWLFILSVFPGVPVSIYLRNSVAWVVFLSVYAVWMQHLIEWHNSRLEAETGTRRGRAAV